MESGVRSPKRRDYWRGIQIGRKYRACVFFLPAEKMGLKLDYTGKLGWYAT